MWLTRGWFGLSTLRGVSPMETGKGPSISSTPSKKLSKEMSKLNGPELSGTGWERFSCCPYGGDEGDAIIPSRSVAGPELLLSLLAAVWDLAALAEERTEGPGPLSDD